MNANSLTVTWSDPDIPYGVIVSYTVTYNLTEDMMSLVTESQTVTLEDLDEYTIYVIYVAASTRIGTGPNAQVYKRTGQASKPCYTYCIMCFNGLSFQNHIHHQQVCKLSPLIPEQLPLAGNHLFQEIEME